MAKDRHRRDEDLLRLYLHEIGQFPLLTRGDEVRLAQQIERGNAARVELDTASWLSGSANGELRRAVGDGERARRTFVQANLRLVVSIAKKYQASGLPLLDLIQDGNLGLLHAVEKFDWRKGFKFSTYATWWIRQAITRGINTAGRTIRLSAGAEEALCRICRARARLEGRLGRAASLEELAVEVDLSVAKVTLLLQRGVEAVSLSQPLGDGDGAVVADVVEDRSAPSPFEAAVSAVLPAEVDRLLDRLDERERWILTLRFGLDRGDARTLGEVAECVGVSRERIRQIEARAMSKLRHPASDTGARSLLAV